MTIRSFKHVSASSLGEATAILSEAKGKAAVIAGGTDLLGVLKDKIHLESPEIVVDLKTIPNLGSVTESDDGLTIGALTTLDDMATHPGIKEKYSLLSQAARVVASPQIRNMGTIGGNICQEPRCWYYRIPDDMFHCLRKGGNKCGALLGENRYHSIFGSVRVGLPGCSDTCPGNVEIPAYMSRLRQGDLDGAAEIVMANNPIPAITGRVCPHFCESKCNRSDFDEAVAIRNVERVVGDHVLDNAARFMAPPEKALDESVAIVGSGPAGLAAAYYLRKEGYNVTIFEKMALAGGMLQYGIPAYRLPKDVLQKQIGALEGMGIDIKLNASVGREGTGFQALRETFDHVFVAAGAWKQRTLNIEKADLLTSGVDFLVEIGSGQKPVLGKKVIVIGGGNVAMDVAVNARHLGAESVTMVCLESRDIMPAFEEEIEHALGEGVTLITSWGPGRILEQGGQITGMEFVRCTSVFDEAGAFNPRFDPAETETLEADQIILAIGQATDLEFTGGTVETQRGLIVIGETSKKTSLDGVYAGGDVTTGPASVIDAVTAGRKTALSIAGKAHESHLIQGQALDMHAGCQGPSQRTADLADVQGIRSEAERCANCGCVAVNVSDLAPALIALDAQIVTTRRTVNAENFFAAAVAKATVLEEDELVTEVKVPAPAENLKQGYLKFRIRNSIDFPIVSLAYACRFKDDKIEDARVVLGAVAPVPLRVRAVEAFLEGKPANQETAAGAGDMAVRQVQTLARNDYKVQIVRGLLRKMVLSLK